MRNAKAPAARALLLLLALMAVALSACGSSSAATPCWKQVTNDWTNNTLGKTTYPLGCYDQAIKHLPPDLLWYSDAPAQIRAAKLAAERKLEKPRKLSVLPVGSSGPGNGGGGGGSGPGSGPGTNQSPVGTLLNAGTSSADSLPVPLIIVGGLALLLLAAGAVAVANRRLQARRVSADDPPA